VWESVCNNNNNSKSPSPLLSYSGAGGNRRALFYHPHLERKGAEREHGEDDNNCY
jgi:hypothetical protein